MKVAPDNEPVAGSDVVAVAKGAQILNLVKENQLITAVIVFFLWQAGALQSGINLLGGVC